MNTEGVLKNLISSVMNLKKENEMLKIKVDYYEKVEKLRERQVKELEEIILMYKMRLARIENDNK